MFVSKIIIIALFLSITILNSCDLFKTREPESPIISTSTYPPATSAQILINNFTLSLKDKNIESYLNCFSTNNYEFSADPSAFALYSSIFDLWKIENEKRIMNNLVSQINKSDLGPIVKFTQENYENLPDSAIYTANYQINFTINNSFNLYQGITRMTLVRTNDGSWTILRWIDGNIKNDTNQTWSFLKAKFSN